MIIVTLTTIPSRIKHLQPVIDNILKQTLPPDRIELYIPNKYKKRSLGKIDPNDFPEGCEIIRCDKDYGPATKILPAIQKYKDQDVTLIYCDDDRIYDKNWIKRLIDKSNQYPNDCIVDEGLYFDWYFFRLLQDTKKVRYRLFRILSIGLWNPKKKILSKVDKFCDVAEGFGGVLVKPDFFTPEVFDIPDILWTVDDIWLSGIMEKNGVKIQVVDRKKSEASYEINTEKDNTKDDSLFSYVYKGYGRDNSNCLCIKYFIDNHGIWKNYRNLSLSCLSSKNK